MAWNISNLLPLVIVTLLFIVTKFRDYALKGTYFRENCFKALIFVNKQLVPELAQLILIFHNDSFQTKLKTAVHTFFTTKPSYTEYMTQSTYA